MKTGNRKWLKRKNIDMFQFYGNRNSQIDDDLAKGECECGVFCNGGWRGEGVCKVAFYIHSGVYEALLTSLKRTS